MPSPNARVPSYRLHKPSGQARVIVNREHIYLGKYGSAESREKYARLIAELASADKQAPQTADTPAKMDPISINEMLLAYWRFAQALYQKNDQPTKELACMREALRPVKELYGSTPAGEFGPKALKAVRRHMVDQGLSRGVVNHRLSRIKRAFKWATGEELIPSSVFHAMQAVGGLRFGQTQARETEPIRPIADLYVAVVLPFVTPHVTAMIKLQRLTGMRASELVVMRSADIDTNGEIWIYEPFDHKNRWRGHRKQIPLGPEAQRILQPFLDRDPRAFLFSPKEAEAWRLEHRPPYHGKERKTKIYPSELRQREKLKAARRQQRKPKRPKGERYNTQSYAKAVNYGMKQAKKAGFAVPHWHPHQLRHNRGTEIRRKYGIEAAQVALGHARADVTEVYAEKNLEQARQIAKEMG
jgi:integrase